MVREILLETAYNDFPVDIVKKNPLKHLFSTQAGKEKRAFFWIFVLPVAFIGHSKAVLQRDGSRVGLVLPETAHGRHSTLVGSAFH